MPSNNSGATVFALETVFLAVVLAITSCGGRAESPDTNSSSAPAPDVGLRGKATAAYIFAYPLVMNYRTMYKQAIEGDHAFGRWLHLGTSSPADTDIVTPNNDSPYSYAWVDLRAEPWVLTMPPVEQQRYYVSQWDDLWGLVLDNPGSVIDGNRGVSVLLAGPDFNGELPSGVSRVVKGEGEFLGTLTRTQLFGTDNDIERVREIQQQYTLQPLSAFLTGGTVLGRAAHLRARAADPG